MALSSCKKEEEEATGNEPAAPSFVHVEQQVPIMYKNTGENCGPCGSWGWDLYSDVSHTNEGKIFTWANYSSGYSTGYFRGQELNSGDPVAQAMQNNFGSSGKPGFFVNGTLKTISPIYISVYTDTINNAITRGLNAPVQASVAMLPVTWDGDKLTVKAEIKLYENLSGEYYMAAYIVEDKAKGRQSGHSSGSNNNNVEHHYVMRGSMTSDNAWGVKVIDGAVNSGEIFGKTFEATVPSSYNKDNITVGVVLWKKQGTYRFVNSVTNQK